MNKTEFIAAVAEKAEISKKDSEKAFKAFVDVVTEQLKAADQTAWTGKMNSIRNRAAEIVNSEIIFRFE